MNSFEPRITVATVVEHNERLLFVREHQSGAIVINQPAGHVEHGETLTQAAFRETLEETTWRVELTAWLGVYIFQPAPGAEVYHRYCFIGEPLGRDDRQHLDDGIIETLWLNPQELQNAAAEHRSPLVAQCVRDYQAGCRLPLDAIYQHPWPLQQR